MSTIEKSSYDYLTKWERFTYTVLRYTLFLFYGLYLVITFPIDLLFGYLYLIFDYLPDWVVSIASVPSRLRIVIHNFYIHKARNNANQEKGGKND